MTRRMSCSMTIEAVRNHTKTVTRRHVDTWKDLKPGDQLTLIEKGMGLPKGARQVVLAEVQVVAVSVEAVGLIHGDPFGTADEGLFSMTPGDFVTFWLRAHGYGDRVNDPRRGDTPCRRIEWRYL